eukprot:1076581-Ditylum_brightwellii.AAC.1
MVEHQTSSLEVKHHKREKSENCKHPKQQRCGWWNKHTRINLSALQSRRAVTCALIFTIRCAQKQWRQ